MGLSLLKTCEELPVSLVEAKVFLRIDTDEEDMLLQNLIETSVQAVEAYTSCALLTQTGHMHNDLAIKDISMKAFALPLRNDVQELNCQKCHLRD